jgi:hypothetical protein
MSIKFFIWYPRNWETTDWCVMTLTNTEGGVDNKIYGIKFSEKLSNEGECVNFEYKNELDETN